ncbi:hypothetical protein [Winogradskyella thalassocola]|uniref:Uncharacterized protein n=1 Tax=Winogradskyella thalassocola TaxID=262004 RepID=A0A1G8IBV2_9FLAO|nr:hypothetical protein [Winogradskyella thalassocola]SDI16332.1 hypothetical protein SAMN04489796_107199 [Winogradskyella thalassocola]
MKTKLHFGLLIILLAFLGTYLEQNALPNQQIVIQFSDTDISTEDSENAIEAIQNKLQSIGVTHIQIGQKNEGQLRIIYHSNTDVEYIQNALFNLEDINIAYDSNQNESDNFPDHKNLKDYELNISEIKASNDVNWDFERTQVVEVNQKTDRFLYSKTNSFGNHYYNIENHFNIKVAVFISNNATTAIDNISYIIPEVRAGPIA